MVRENDMAQLIKAPSEEKPKYISVFLAGGITNCGDWQKEVEEHLSSIQELSVINPRNDKFDVTDISASRKQIKWEFEHLEKTDIFSIYFCNSGSVQPICLYELGRNIVRMQQRFPNDWEDRIVISIENGYSRYLDVVEQTSLCAPKLWININATPKSHAMRIGEKFAKLDE